MVCAPVRRDNHRALARGLSTVQARKNMLCLTCSMISSVDLAHYGLSRVKDWVSGDCGTICFRFCFCILNFLVFSVCLSLLKSVQILYWPPHFSFCGNYLLY